MRGCIQIHIPAFRLFVAIYTYKTYYRSIKNSLQALYLTKTFYLFNSDFIFSYNATISDCDAY